MRPVNSARAENRSSVESQNAPNSDWWPVMYATLPSMKSKMLAQIMMTPAGMNRSRASAQPAMQLISTPISVSVFGEMPRDTLALMMARNGNMQTFPTVPVNVMLGYNERFDE